MLGTTKLKFSPYRSFYPRIPSPNILLLLNFVMKEEFWTLCQVMLGPGSLFRGFNPRTTLNFRSMFFTHQPDFYSFAYCNPAESVPDYPAFFETAHVIRTS